MGNIKHNNYRDFDCRIINDNNLDFMLLKHKITPLQINKKIITNLDFKNLNDEHVISNIAWENAVPSNKILTNIGYTGVDNGMLKYEKDRICNEEFLNIFINSNLDLSTYNDKFFVTEVSGNTSSFTYPIEKHSDYVSLKGGFYQGFFKIDGDKYQTLPHRIEDEWNFTITLRKKEYKTPSNILNKRYYENNGIFFYIGTRAENKFWELYKKKEDIKNFEIDNGEDYFDENNFIKNNVTRYDVFQKENKDDDITPHETRTIDINVAEQKSISDENYFEGDYYTYDIENEIIDYSDYFNHEFNPYDDNDENNKKEKTIYKSGIFECVNTDYLVEEDYFQKQTDLYEIELADSKERNLNENGFYEIKTDNKFIIFNQTKNGFNKNTWNDEYQYMLTGKTIYPNLNYYIYMNNTKTGYTKDSIHLLNEEHKYAYNVIKDIENNAFALKINENGSISYRFLTYKGELLEETSTPGIIKNDEWVTISLKMKRTKKRDVCDKDIQSNMKLYIYVNEYLKFVSKELPELLLKPLNDAPERQEGVPYNISIGGGSQGLMERIMIDYYDIIKYQFPIEKYFAGSFIGDIKDFSFSI